MKEFFAEILDLLAETAHLNSSAKRVC